MTDTVLDTIHINYNNEALWAMNLVLAIVMFGIALEISINDFKQLWLKPKPVLVGVCSQFLVLPAITFLLIYTLAPYPSIALGMLMVAACPGGNMSNFFSHLAGANTALSVCLTAIATILAVVLTPVNLQFWGSLYPPTAAILESVAISPFQMVKLVALILGLPLLLGMLVHHFLPVLAARMAKVLKIVSLVFFVFLVGIALYNNRGVFLEYVSYVFWLVLAHNCIAFLTGFTLAKAFRLSQENTKAITIETGIQNAGLGLLLIFTFFDGLGGMALVAAFWGIWHIVSGLILAYAWNTIAIRRKKIVQ